MIELDKCQYCRAKEFSSILREYGWCRFCMYDNMKLAVSRGVHKGAMEYLVEVLSSFPTLPKPIEDKNTGESKTDLAIDYGIIKQKLQTVVYPKDLKEIFNA